MQHSEIYPCTPCLRDICAALLYYINLETPSKKELILLTFINFIMVDTMIIAMVVAVIAAMGLL